MKTIFLTFSLMFTAFFAFCQTNSSKELTNSQERDVPNFTGVKVQNAITVELIQGNSNSVTVFATDSDDQNKVITEVNDGILNIKLESGNWGWSWKNKKILVKVTIQTINFLEASGASQIKIINKLLSDDIKIKSTGASSIKGEIKSMNLSAGLSGASSIKITGIAGNVEIKASGASSFKGYEFTCKEANINLSGASNTNINVLETLYAKASGASSISYKGNPNVRESKNSGASSIKQHKD